MSKLTLRARWVLPVDGPALNDGVVSIDAGRIVAVEQFQANAIEVPGPRRRCLDAGIGERSYPPGIQRSGTAVGQARDARFPAGSVR